MPTPADLEVFLGHDVNVEQAEAHLGIVTALAKAYTRGNGFTGDDPVPELDAVIVTATARLLSNPEGTTFESLEDYQIRPGSFQGWNLVEAITLNRYRRRAM